MSGKEGVGGRWKKYQRHFPRTLQALGVAIEDLTKSDTPFFGIVSTEGEYPLGHIYLSITFGTQRTVELSS